MLTGTYVHTNRTYNNATPWPFEIKTLAHHFGAHGYMSVVEDGTYTGTV